MITPPINILPCEARSFKHKGINDTLSAEGVMNDVVIANYKLFLSTEGGEKKQLLLSTGDIIENLNFIMFVSDFDGDEKPDIMLNISVEHFKVEPTLYLSSPAAADELLIPFAHGVEYGVD